MTALVMIYPVLLVQNSSCEVTQKCILWVLPAKKTKNKKQAGRDSESYSSAMTKLLHHLHEENNQVKTILILYVV